jgi:L-2-hydroxyglutarate oxidase LhgO
MGLGLEYDSFPFKGHSFISETTIEKDINAIVYPVPLKGTSLGGSHSSLTLDRKIKIGPAMIPCEAFEDYGDNVVDENERIRFKSILEKL